jgi:hypothetical protein
MLLDTANIGRLELLTVCRKLMLFANCVAQRRCDRSVQHQSGEVSTCQGIPEGALRAWLINLVIPISQSEIWNISLSSRKAP